MNVRAISVALLVAASAANGDLRYARELALIYTELLEVKIEDDERPRNEGDATAEMRLELRDDVGLLRRESDLLRDNAGLMGNGAGLPRDDAGFFSELVGLSPSIGGSIQRGGSIERGGLIERDGLPSASSEIRGALFGRAVEESLTLIDSMAYGGIARATGLSGPEWDDGVIIDASPVQQGSAVLTMTETVHLASFDDFGASSDSGREGSGAVFGVLHSPVLNQQASTAGARRSRAGHSMELSYFLDWPWSARPGHNMFYWVVGPPAIVCFAVAGMLIISGLSRR